MEISLRKVEKSDWDYILNLRNLEKFRDNFYQKHTISKSEHYQYLTKQEANPNFLNWIISVDKKNAGYLRILDSDVSIIVDEAFHNMGVGTQALKIMEKEAKKLGIKKLIGKVMIHNKESEKIFQKNNYKLLMYWYEKDLTNN